MTQRRVCPIAVKAIDESREFSGYASVFGVVDSYTDVVIKGAFTRTLAERRPALLWQHDPTVPIGVWEEMREDETGLFVRGRLADTVAGRDAYELLKLGALSGLSIGYRTVKSAKRADVRELLDVDLMETSLVTFPANDAARVQSVKATDWDAREWESRLRDVFGLSQRQAKAFIADGLKGFRRDAESESAADAEMAAQIHQLAAALRAARE